MCDNREIVLETPLQRLLLNLSKAISTQTQLQPAFHFPLKFCPPKDSMPEVHKAHSALVNAVKDNAAKDNEAKVDSEDLKDNEAKVDSGELKANVVKELKVSEEHKDNVVKEQLVQARLERKRKMFKR